MPSRDEDAALVGIDWGTTHRRALLVAADGRVLAEHADGEGALACAGLGGRRFRASLEALLETLGAAADLPVAMAGMVGSAAGWQFVPYLEGDAALADLAQRLVPVGDAPVGRRWSIAPGWCLRGPGHPDDAAVDVMRGEETQLFGALQLLGDAADGSYVLPGTHSKWVRLEGGRIVALRTYMSGELFGLLSRHGTLASAMRPDPAADDTGTGLRHAVVADDPAFLSGVREAAGSPALSHALFGVRARVVTGSLPSAAAAACVSGLLIGAEWADAARLAGADEPVRVIGEPALAALHRACAAFHGRPG